MTMKLHTAKSDAPSAVLSASTQVLLVGVFENDFPNGPAAEVNTACGGSLVGQARTESFKGTVGQTLVHFNNNAIGAERVLLYGLGGADKFSVATLRAALTAAFLKVQGLKQNEVTVARVSLDGTGVSAFEFGRTLAEISGMVDYVINHQKTEKAGFKAEVRVTDLKVMARADEAGPVKRGMEAGRIVASAVNNARDLVNMPAGQCTPNFLATQAQRLQTRTKGAVKVRLVRRAELRKLGLNAFLAVSQGSVQEPVLIELTYDPANAVSPDFLGLVGKSITFDSGGLDLKPADGMRLMKGDMAGGAAVLSAIGAIAALKLPVRVKAYMAATENMPDGKSYKPGDVLTTMAGLTVEVDNTDAEGRLTLVDAIEYARRIGGVTRIIDLATLTGAVRQTCGYVGAGAFGNTDEWTAQVIAAGASVGERLFAMPMWPELAKANDSELADLKNSGGAAFGAGSSTAALFISRFAEGIPWVHLDIASVAVRSVRFEADPAGATGFGTRTLVALVEAIARAAA